MSHVPYEQDTPRTVYCHTLHEQLRTYGPSILFDLSPAVIQQLVGEAKTPPSTTTSQRS